ncbi:MAG: cytochrome c4 [Alphaproteobacteria bacterium]|jgi:cytochrome c553|nr:cytochrome c4 [Alphaproteobacteria bacterium]
MTLFGVQAARTISGVFLSGFVLAFLFGPAGAARAAETACASFPKVPWWGELSHRSVGQLVERRYGGNWKAYIRLWEKNLSKLREIRGKNSRAVIRSQAAKKKRKLLAGPELEKYIENVAARLKVTRCLAEQAEQAKEKTKEEKNQPDIRTTNLREQSTIAGGQLAEKMGCNYCHGESGISTHRGYPNLAGQSELYLIKQLKEFQAAPVKTGETSGTGRRHSRSMTPRAKELSDDDVWNLAAHFARLNACSQATDRAQAPPQPKIAARCVECHGLEGNGVFPEVPNLAGQKRDYLLAQLKAFRQAGQDKAGKDKKRAPGTRYHYFMSPLVRDFSNGNLEHLADYFSEVGCGS